MQNDEHRLIYRQATSDYTLSAYRSGDYQENKKDVVVTIQQQWFDMPFGTEVLENIFKAVVQGKMTPRQAAKFLESQCCNQIVVSASELCQLWKGIAKGNKAAK